MLAAPRTLAEVPLPRLEVAELLGLAPDAAGQRRALPDHDFEGYGYGVADELVLEAADGERTELSATLVLALHSTDDAEPGEPIELELDIPDPSGGEGLTIRAPLDAFLRAHLPRLPVEAPDVVLALCNPHGVDVERPAGLGRRRLHWAHGDVHSWLDVYDDGRAQIRLQARRWTQG